MSSYEIRLNYIDRSSGKGNTDTVIFARNAYTDTPWIKFQNVKGSVHPFTYPLSFTISAFESNGQHTREVSASAGQGFCVVPKGSGIELELNDSGTSVHQIVVQNDLEERPVRANLLKAGSIFLAKSIAPGERRAFEVDEVYGVNIFMGVISSTGAPVSVLWEIDLFGLVSADIVLTGGTDPSSDPFNFSLENVREFERKGNFRIGPIHK